MPVCKAYADAIAKKHFGEKVFDMCWDGEPEPLVETPMVSSSAEPQYGSQMFEMFWDIKSDAGPMVNASANAPAEASIANPDNSFQGSYDLCWDELSSSKIGSVPAITVEAATPPAATAPAITVEAATPPATTFDVCWDDRPATSAMEYKGGFDMCWEDNPTTTVNHPETSGSQDQRASQTPSSASTEVSVMAKVESGEPLVCQAADRLARMSAVMGDKSNRGCHRYHPGQPDLDHQVSTSMQPVHDSHH
ncbi:hypothetical protein P692DRAFT_20880082 [Suillus brevipes Sb2]|nr:hypothetical protein P692DRAFT_20880082 [Suillus brevipes Sb2]